MMNEPFAELLKICGNLELITSGGDSSSELKIHESNPDRLTPYDIAKALRYIFQMLGRIRDKLELYERTFATLFGNEEHKQKFLEYLQQHTTMDNFDFVQLTNAINKIKKGNKNGQPKS